MSLLSLNTHVYTHRLRQQTTRTFTEPEGTTDQQNNINDPVLVLQSADPGLRTAAHGTWSSGTFTRLNTGWYLHNSGMWLWPLLEPQHLHRDPFQQDQNHLDGSKPAGQTQSSSEGGTFVSLFNGSSYLVDLIETKTSAML